MSLEFTPDPRQESEARLTALLLGEITGAEAASLLETIEADPQLAALYERLKKTVVLVREVSANPAQPLATPGANPATPLKLSEERRQKLLAQFKTVKPKEFVSPAQRRQWFETWFQVGIAAAIVLLLGSLAVPNLVHSRFTAQQTAIINKLRQLDGAKQTWALENHASPDTVPTFAQIQPYMGRGEETDPQASIAGEKYILGPIGKSPVAVQKGKVFSLDDEGQSPAVQMMLAAKTPTPSVNIKAKFAEVTPETTPSASPAASAPQQLAQNNRQQIYLPPADNGATLSVTPAEPASNFGRQLVLADGSVQQYSTSGLRAPGVLRGTEGNVVVTNSANATFFADLNGSGSNAGNPESTSILNSWNQPAPHPPSNYSYGATRANDNFRLNLADVNQLERGQSNNSAVAPVTSLQSGDVQLSCNTQPTAGVPPPPARVAPPNLRLGLTEQLSEPQIVTESGKRTEAEAKADAEATRKAGLALAEPAKDFSKPPDRGGLAEEKKESNANVEQLPELGEVPTAGRLFKSTTPADQRKPVFQNQHGAQLLTQHTPSASDRDQPLGLTPLPGSRAPEAETAAASALPAAPPLASASVPEQPTTRGGLVSNEALFQDGKLLFEAGRLDEAEAKLNEAYKENPSNVSAYQYLQAIQQEKAREYRATNGVIKYADASDVQEALKNLSGSTASAANDKHSDKILEELNRNRLLTESRLDDLRKKHGDTDAEVKRLRDSEQELDAKIEERKIKLASGNKAEPEADFLSSRTATPDINDAPLPKTVVPPPIPQPEVFTSTNAFSTFSLNIADVSFKLAAASLEKGVMPDPASIRSEEFINAFDYRDPEAPPGVPIAFAWERARYPFAQNRDLLRFSLKTAATGRAPGRPLNIVLLLDNSGSMERADRVQIIREALRVLAGQLQPQDTLSIITFARTARLFVDGVPGNQASNVVEEVSGLTPQGGTNLEDAMRLAYETALRHYLANGINRVVLMTDGAANLGNVDPASLKQSVEAHRKQGIALDCFGIGWEGYNDDLLEVLARNGDGRYGFLNSPEEAANGFAHQLAGALNVAAEDVKVQVEFNPRRVTVYRQIGYAKLQLTKEQFRDNTVAAAQVGAAEAGNALYTLQVDPNGDGPLATVRVRYKVPGTEDFQEHEWSVPYTGNALSLEQSTPAMHLAATASAFSEWLANSPYAAEVTPDALLQNLSGVPAIYAPDTRPQKLVEMIREAKSLTGK
ncbi:MAG TPA: von Willebrand factor type A domain-containing protein [Verrucomicrobiae bacterium]|nr:von Willebrand factor type A domain-containing protein [Verrucomicrobiae bacterium]